MLAALSVAMPLITTVLDRVISDPKAAVEAKERAMQMAQAGEFKALDAELQLALAQAEINKVEAGTDFFRGGWRPATGWSCVAGLMYQFLLQPILPWVVRLFGAEVEPLPPIDSETLMVLLFGMLGLGGLRTYERVRGKI